MINKYINKRNILGRFLKYFLKIFEENNSRTILKHYKKRLKNIF